MCIHTRCALNQLVTGIMSQCIIYPFQSIYIQSSIDKLRFKGHSVQIILVGSPVQAYSLR